MTLPLVMQITAIAASSLRLEMKSEQPEVFNR
jgi:hypothetical protein